jgi:hypothetical protein
MSNRDLPTKALERAVNAMCERNERSRGAVTKEIYLGSRVVLVTLARPIVIEGECWDVEPAGEVDMLDLINDWRGGRR